jgi:hypothetical protein
LTVDEQAIHSDPISMINNRAIVFRLIDFLLLIN